jgi:hypothetical protein
MQEFFHGVCRELVTGDSSFKHNISVVCSHEDYRSAGFVKTRQNELIQCRISSDVDTRGRTVGGSQWMLTIKFGSLLLPNLCGKYSILQT